MSNNQSRTFKYFSVVAYGSEMGSFAKADDCLFASPVHTVNGIKHRHFIFGYSSFYTVGIIKDLLSSGTSARISVVGVPASSFEKAVAYCSET